MPQVRGEAEAMIYPTMSYREFILKFAAETQNGKFHCETCGCWIDKQRWIHFKDIHRIGKDLSVPLDTH